MNSFYIKIIHVVVILIFLLNLSIIASSSSNATPQNTTTQKILAIYTPDTLNMVNTIYNDRVKINNESLSLTLKNLENGSQINSLLNNHQLNQSYNEFWIITENFHDFQPEINQIITKILSFNLPTLIWSADLQDLNSSILTKLGITSCNPDPIQFDYSSLSFDYTNITSLSTLLNITVPTIQQINGAISYSDCQLNQNDYNILNLISAGSTTLNPSNPIIFQPQFKSNILVASFYFQNDTQDTNVTSNTTTNIITTTISGPTNMETSTLDNSIYGLFSYQPLKISKVSQISVANLLSALTYSNSINWAYSSTLGSVITNGFSGTVSTGSNTYYILQTGFQFPKIDPKLATNIAIGSSLVALLGVFILLIRRYWIFILGLFIGIFAVFKVPSRKISMMDVYHNETRQNIIDHLNFRKSQGETVRNLSRELSIPLPTLLWHLQILEEFELIVKEKVKREIVIISMDYVDDFDLELKVFEMTFKSDKAKIFYDYLLNLKKGEIFTITSVVTHTSWSTRTVIRYISKLLELQIIEQNPLGKGYKISNDYFTKLQELN